MTKETPSQHFLKRSHAFLKGAIKEVKEEGILKAKDLDEAYKKTKENDSIKFKGNTND